MSPLARILSTNVPRVFPILLSLLLFATACGSSSFVRKDATYRLPTGCGQRPMEVRLRAAGTKYAEALEVFACAPHRFSGQAEILVDGHSFDRRSFGENDPSNRCLARPGELRATDVTVPATSAAEDSSGAASSTWTAAAASALAPVEITGVGSWPDEVCERHGLVATTVVMHTTWQSYDGPVFEPGAELLIRFWPETPADLGGGFLVVHHFEFRPKDMAKVDREMAERRERAIRAASAASPTAESKPPRPQRPAGPPPPPRAETPPPRPNANAEWIPGYWVRAGAEWRWIAGFWRARNGDLTAGVPGRWELRGDVYVWISIDPR